MNTRAMFAAAALLASAPALAAPSGEAVLNPHTREACLHCHKGGLKGLGPGRTTIFPSTDEPHAVVAGSCRSCHKEGQQDFWLVILPPAGGRPAVASPSLAPSAAPVPAVAGAAPQPRTIAPAPASPIGAGEGFDNKHDAMACKDCHDRTAEELKAAGGAPQRVATQGVDAFCRSCHGAVDRSHYPRGNVPAAATTCLSCHRAHGRSLFFPSLRDDFQQTLAESTGLNPHGGRIFCLACHPDTPQPDTQPALRFPGNSLLLCQRCHAGVEHHPLGVKSTPATWKMDFSHTPLENEAVVCISCHKPPECQGAVGRENPRFLRGGPYNTVEEFCQRCHEGKQFSSLDPHDQIDESGEIYRRKCLYCHTTVPAAGAEPETLEYTDTLTALCVSCHPVGPHPNADHLLPMPRDKGENLREYEELRRVRLPLDGGAVTCVTCHNPHERGLLKGPAGIGADEDKRLRLTTYNEQCTPCHGRR